VVLIGCAFSSGIFGILQYQLDTQHRVEFGWVARERIRTLVHEVHNFLDQAQLIADLYHNDPKVSRESFLELTREVLSRSPGFRSMAWVVPTGGAADRFAVQQIDPIQDLLPRPGSILDGRDSIGRVLMRSREQGAPSLSGHLALTTSAPDEFGIMLVTPVYDDSIPIEARALVQRELLGFSLAFFHLDSLTRKAIGLLEPRGVEVLVMDESAPPGERLLEFYHSRIDPQAASSEQGVEAWLASKAYRLTRRAHVADRVWTLHAVATRHFRSGEAFQHGPVFGLVAGLLFTALLTLYLVRQQQHLSARQRVNKRRQEREQLFWQLTEAIDGVLWAVQPGLPGFLYVSPACERIIGIPSEPLYQDMAPLAAVTPKKDWRGLRSMIARIRRSGQTATLQFRVKREGERTRWIRVQGFPVLDRDGVVTRVVGFAQDITTERLAAKTLRKSEAQLRTLFNESPDILMTVDRAAKIQSMNRSFPGLPVVGQPGDSSVALVPEEFRDWYLATLERTFETGEIGHFRYSGEDATWWEIRTVPVRSKKRVEAALVIASDVTAQHELQERATRSARLASLGVLAAGIAHEVNNPNSAVLFNARIVGRAWSDALPVLEAYRAEYGDFSLAGLPALEASETVGRLVSEIGKNAERIGRIIENLKRLARQGDEKRTERVDIVAVLQDAVMVLHNQIHRHTDAFRLEVPEGLPPVLGNFQQLAQVFVNVILNALLALPDRTRAVCVQASADAEARAVVVEVSDQGVGVSEEIRHRLTEPFFTTRGEKGGTGLGLSITKTILEHHRGRIDIESFPGCGTLVTITLPQIEESST